MLLPQKLIFLPKLFNTTTLIMLMLLALDYPATLMRHCLNFCLSYTYGNHLVKQAKST